MSYLLHLLCLASLRLGESVYFHWTPGLWIITADPAFDKGHQRIKHSWIECNELNHLPADINIRFVRY